MSQRYTLLIEALTEGVSVLTVNRRLSRRLHSRYESAMLERGLLTWDTPEVMPLSSWIRARYRESRPSKPLLSDTRSAALWKKIISRDKALQGMGIISPKGLARQAYNAYVLMSQYGLCLPAEQSYLTEEVRAFLNWLGEYERELARLGFIDYPMLLGRMGALIEKGTATSPKEVVLAGFDEITPVMKALLASLGQGGCEVSFWPQEPGAEAELAVEREKSFVEIREYEDEVHEVRAAARWARLQAEAGKKAGIIVPELERYRDLVIREFSAELEPASILRGERAAEVFNVSLGEALIREPIVRSALDIISLNLRAQDLEQIAAVVNSPYFLACGQEHMALARLWRRLREKKNIEIGLIGLKKAAERLTPRLNAFRERLDFWIKSIKDKEGPQLPGEWAAYFDTLLTGLLWPSPGLTLNSREYQALGAWYELLSEFARLDDVVGRLTRSEAAAELRVLAGETMHQPQSPVESPVEVLGILEASGLYFDTIRLLGGHEGALPGEASPNPFIPLNLQKKAELPRSTPELTLAFASAALNRILDSAPEVSLSFPRLVEGVGQSVSPLLKGRGEVIKKGSALTGHRLVDSIHAAFDVEGLPDERHVPLLEAEQRRLRGGTSIIKDQSACPFRAFAVHRLGASAVGTPQAGLDAMDKGNIAHEALRLFWEEVKDSGHLREAAEEGRLRALISEAVAKAIGDFRGSAVSKKVLELEAQSLQALLEAWMANELERDEFFVEEMETTREIEVGGLTIRARLDRVDRLSDGARIIIDYKTGVCSKDYWLPGRPKEPQMLLYGLESGFNAIAFASLKIKNTRFVGVGSDDGLLPGVKGLGNDKWRLKIEGADNWDELTERWRETLTGLGEDFVAGAAAVDPNSTLKGRDCPCNFCELSTLCRVFEAELRPVDDDEGEGRGQDT